MSSLVYYIVILERNYYSGFDLLKVSKSFNKLIPVLESWTGANTVYAYEVIGNSKKIVGRFSYIDRMSNIKLFTNYSSPNSIHTYPEEVFIMLSKEKSKSNAPIKIWVFEKFSEVIEAFIEYGLHFRTEVYATKINPIKEDYDMIGIIVTCAEHDNSDCLFYNIGKQEMLEFAEAFKSRGLEVPPDLTRILRKNIGA